MYNIKPFFALPLYTNYSTDLLHICHAQCAFTPLQQILPIYCTALHASKLYIAILLRQMISAKNDLRQHLKDHTDERPFLCRHCEKRFRSKSDWRVQMRTHTGEKLFKCSHCEQRFASSCCQHASSRATPALDKGEDFPLQPMR